MAKVVDEYAEIQARADFLTANPQPPSIFSADHWRGRGARQSYQKCPECGRGIVVEGDYEASTGFQHLRCTNARCSWTN